MSDILKQSRPVPVPSGRMNRISRMGSLAAGVAGTMAVNGLIQLGKGDRPTARDLLLTPGNIRRNDLFGGMFEQVFFIQSVHLPAWRQAGGKFRYPVVQEREAALHAVCQRNSIALRAENVARHQHRVFQDLGLAKGGPASLLLRQ